MTIRSFGEKLDVVFQHLSELDRRVQTSPAARDAPLAEALEEWRNTLEELRVADEELRVQNEELTASRQALEEESRRYQDLFEFAPDGYVVTDVFGVIREANTGASALLNVPKNELIGKPLVVYVAGKEHAAFRSLISRLQIGLASQEQEMRLDPRDKPPVPVAMMVSSVPGQKGKVVTVRWLLRDISSRKQAEDQLRQSLEQARLLAQHLETVREEERTRIAREIHDELGVRLTCLKFDLARVNALASRPSSPETLALLEDKVGAMTRQTDETITRMQQLATELRPGILDDLGLVAALEWQAHDFQDRTGIFCSLHSSAEDFPLDQNRATALFRICQEALTNVARHSGGTHATIRLSETDSPLVLEVKDDGTGISEEKISDSRSLGLIGMRERVMPFGGEVRVTGIPGEGTTLTIFMPLDEPPLEPGGDEHGSRTPRSPVC